jgi:hypothetical protein
MKMHLHRINRKRMNAWLTTELDLNETYSEAYIPSLPARREHSSRVLILY